MRGDSARGLLIAVCSVGVAFLAGYPLHISLLRVHSPKDYVYNAIFWGSLLAAMILISTRWLRAGKRWWIPVICGIAIGYGSSLVGYAGLIAAVGRVQNLKESADFLFVLAFPLIAFGWLLGGIAATSAYAMDCLLSGRRSA